jgi:hypothetical protein
MNFSADRFAEVMSHLSPQMRSHGGKEKRRAQRLRQRADLTIIPYTDAGPGKPATVELRDFSTRGVRLIRKEMMVCGDEFIVMLPRKTGRPVPMLCTVAHVEKNNDTAGGYSIGAEFVCVTPGAPPSKPNATPTEADVERIRHSMLD